MNKKPFNHRCYWGTIFACDTCDFSTPIYVTTSCDQSSHNFLVMYSKDLSEMIGYHATNIWPELNGFQGYDTLTFIFE